MTTALPPITGPDRRWWTTSRRRVFLDTHTPDWSDPHQRGNSPDPSFPVLSEVHPESDMALLADAGVDSVVVFAKCQYGNSYFPTSVGRPHGALAGRDLFGEQLRAAHERGMRVIAYFSNMWDTSAALTHPEWRMVPAPGRGSTGRWPALCLRSPYRQLALDHVREIARDYPIDGLWSDILTAGPCVCPRCAEAFRTEYGRDFPADRADPGWIDLVHFSQRTILDYLAEQHAVLRAERPDAAFIPNYYATTFVDAVTGLAPVHLSLADIGSSEGYTDWHGLGFPSFAAASIAAGMGGGPREVLVSRFVHTWDFTLRSPAQLRFEAFTVAAHGATVSLDDQPYATGALEPEVYRRMTPVFERIRERSPWLDGARPVRYAALYASQRGRELESRLGAPENPSNGEQSAQFPQSEPRTADSDLVAAVTGSYRALVEAHLPVALIDERAESLTGLPGHRVLVLADVLSLDADEVTAIDAFVRAGGGLVVTGEAGIRDGRGERTDPDPRLTELLGVRFGQRAGFRFPYLALGDELGAQLGRWPLPHYGRMPRLEPVDTTATVLATRIDPVLDIDDDTYWHNNQPAPGPDTGEPVIVERAVDRGRVIVSAARLGNNRARLGHAAYGDLLAELVRRAAGVDPVVGIEGRHRATELVVAERRGEVIAHLVTGSPVVALDLYGAHQPAAVEDIASVPELRLRAPAGTVGAHRLVDGQAVPLALEDGTVVIARADDWETVVFAVEED